MSQQTETIRTGDSPAVGLSGDLIAMLSSFLGGDQRGAGDAGLGTRPIEAGDGLDRTGNITNVLSDILGGGAGKLGGAFQQLINQQIGDEVGASRARFGASGGVSRGTPAAVAEGTIRARSAPALTAAVGNLQLQTLTPLLQLMAGLAGRGLPQAEDSVLVKDNPLVTGLGALSGLAEGTGSVLTGLRGRR